MGMGYYASTLQDGGVGFDTMLIGFSLDLSALPKLSCSTDRTCKCLASQLWVFCLQKSPRRPKIHESDCKPSTCLACLYLKVVGTLSI